MLGVSFEERGLGVAKVWGFPPTLAQCLHRPGADPPLKLAQKGEDRARWLAHAAGEMTDALLLIARSRFTHARRKFSR